jgi:precorrin-6A/cobalt-precorrin-6A reductase
MDVIRKHKICVLVTKDSGGAGGVAQKLEATRMSNCEIVVVARPDSDAQSGRVWSDVTEMVEAMPDY